MSEPEAVEIQLPPPSLTSKNSRDVPGLRLKRFQPPRLYRGVGRSKRLRTGAAVRRASAFREFEAVPLKISPRGTPRRWVNAFSDEFIGLGMKIPRWRML